MWSNGLVAIAAFVVGSALALQGLVNAGLARGLGSSLIAVAISFWTGAIALTTICLLIGGVGPALASARSLGPAWWVGGGLLGMSFVSMITFAVPRIGVGATMALVISGQLIGAAIFDHYGVLGSPVHPLNAARALGVALLLSGVVLVRFY